MGLDPVRAATGEWECMECGYIEAGVKTSRPNACPDCGAPGQALEFFPDGDDDAPSDLEVDLVVDPVDLDGEETG